MLSRKELRRLSSSARLISAAMSWVFGWPSSCSANCWGGPPTAAAANRASAACSATKCWSPHRGGFGCRSSALWQA
eukprot:1381938-Lingulodinium_polyedra.AAC.1